MFELDTRLANDTLMVGRFDLSLLLLHRDANYPWFILVPMRAGIREIHHLTDGEQVQLLRESAAVAQAMEKTLVPDKLNIAALGNVVPQLHVHHIARYRTDPAWPGPVWGAVPASAYAGDGLRQRARALALALVEGASATAPAFTPALT